MCSTPTLAHTGSIFRSCELGRLSLPQLQNILHSNFPVDVAEGEVSSVQDSDKLNKKSRSGYSDPFLVRKDPIRPFLLVQSPLIPDLQFRLINFYMKFLCETIRDKDAFLFLATNNLTNFCAKIKIKEDLCD
jgi:hypothetical protein